MALSDLTKKAVKQAIAEFNQLGREAFLAKHNYGIAREYFVIHKGRYYDSKALAWAAHRYLGKTKKPLRRNFSGGEASVRTALQKLGFKVTGPGTKPFIGAAPADVLSHAELCRRFKVGIRGGMRRNKEARHLILISDAFQGLYDDRWEGDILHYTGEGTIGQQRIIRQNRTLFNSRETGEVVHLFEVLEPTQYTYVGEVELVNAPYQETQADDDGNPLLVWMFPIKPKPGSYKPVPTLQQIKKVEQKRAKKVSKLSKEELKKRAKAAKGKPPKRTVTTEQYSRDQAVIDYVKWKAKGRCDLCKERAPFRTKKNIPYLECHHIKQLAKDGEDAISNAVALCPNCHRKMHSLNPQGDIAKLKKRVRARDKGL